MKYIRWYDYFYVFLAADMISAGIVNFDLFLVAVGICGWIIYEWTCKLEGRYDNF